MKLCELKNSGFVLFECIFSLIILSILAAILMSLFCNLLKKVAHQSHLESLYNSVFEAVNIIANDISHAGYFNCLPLESIDYLGIKPINIYTENNRQIIEIIYSQPLNVKFDQIKNIKNKLLLINDCQHADIGYAENLIKNNSKKYNEKFSSVSQIIKNRYFTRNNFLYLTDIANNTNQIVSNISDIIFEHNILKITASGWGKKISIEKRL